MPSVQSDFELLVGCPRCLRNSVENIGKFRDDSGPYSNDSSPTAILFPISQTLVANSQPGCISHDGPEHMSDVRPSHTRCPCTPVDMGVTVDVGGVTGVTVETANTQVSSRTAGHSGRCSHFSSSRLFSGSTSSVVSDHGPHLPLRAMQAPIQCAAVGSVVPAVRRRNGRQGNTAENLEAIPGRPGTATHRAIAQNGTCAQGSTAAAAAPLSRAIHLGGGIPSESQTQPEPASAGSPGRDVCPSIAVPCLPPRPCGHRGQLGHFERTGRQQCAHSAGSTETRGEAAAESLEGMHPQPGVVDRAPLRAGGLDDSEGPTDLDEEPAPLEDLVVQPRLVSRSHRAGMIKQHRAGMGVSTSAPPHR